MLAGIPMVPFLLVTGTFILLGFWAAYFLSIYLSLMLFMGYVPLFLYLKQITKKDDQRLHQIILRMKMRLRHAAGKRFWKAISYAPLTYKTRRST